MTEGGVEYWSTKYVSNLLQKAGIQGTKKYDTRYIKL